MKVAQEDRDSGVEKTEAPKIGISEKRRIHILDGDATGGGHGPGRNKPGKSEFPSYLTDDQVIDGIIEIANNPASYPNAKAPTGRGRFFAIGEILDVRTKVIVEPTGEGVITAWPVDTSPNPGQYC